MSDADELARISAAMAEPARARMLTALMSGLALTATELALEAEVVPSTASTHLARLVDAGIVSIEKQGRHRYFRLVDESVAEVLESLIGFATREPSRRFGPSDPALREARVCYDHLAGERGVWLLDALREGAWLQGRDAFELTERGIARLERIGVDPSRINSGSRRPLCRPCLDWSERRHHLGGALGAALLERILALRWATREPGSRVVTFTPHGSRAFQELFSAV